METRFGDKGQFLAVKLKAEVWQSCQCFQHFLGDLNVWNRADENLISPSYLLFNTSLDFHSADANFHDVDLHSLYLHLR